jgi:hypothetical protein
MAMFLGKMVCLAVCMLFQEVVCMKLPTVRQIMQGQIIELPREGLSEGKVYPNCFEQYPIYPADAIFYREPLYDFKKGTSILMARNAIQDETPPFFMSNRVVSNKGNKKKDSFLEMVKAPILERDTLIQNIQNIVKYSNINEKDKEGRTPLHILATRSDATTELVAIFLLWGANPNLCTNSYRVERQEFAGDNVYKHCINYLGLSPKAEQWKPYAGTGDAKIARFVFNYILYQKLERIKEQRRKEKRKQKQEEEIIAAISKKLACKEITYKDIDWSKMPLVRKTQTIPERVK